MSSIMVIGVGTTGLHIMEEAQQYYYEFTKQDSPGNNNSAFLYIETDAGANARLTPNGTTSIERLGVYTINIAALLTQWHATNNDNWGWLPTNANILDAQTGAGGQPVVGRVGLWANLQNVRNTITNLYARINGNANTNIYITGALTGGTGTGVFLDLAYIVRSITNNGNIYGLFLLPNEANVGDQTMQPLYENAWVSLKTIDYHSLSDANGNGYNCTFPGGTTVAYAGAPFKNTQFLTQDFSNSNASLPDVQSLIRSAGFNLVLRYLDIGNNGTPFQSLVDARLIDYTTNEPRGIFTTIGFNMFQYPEGLLEEYFATDIIENDFLYRWADPNNFIDDNGNEINIGSVNNVVRNKTRHFLQNAIKTTIEACQGMPILNSAFLEDALRAEADTIIGENFQAPSTGSYIFSLFSSSNTNKLYSAITGQQYVLRDYLTEKIREFINEQSSRYQNLALIDTILNEIVKTLQAIRKDLNSRYSIDGNGATWNNIWGKEVEKRFNSQEILYAVIGVKKDFYMHHLSEIAKLCYYNAIYPMLDNIELAMKNVPGTGQLISASGIVLPTLSDIKEITNKVQSLLNNQKEFSITSRKNGIGGRLKQQNHPQLNFVFANPQNDFMPEIGLAKGKYNNLGVTKRLSLSNLTQGEQLWDFLDRHGEAELTASLIKVGVSTIQKLQLFGQNDIVQTLTTISTSMADHPLYNKINTILQKGSGDITIQTPAMCKLDTNHAFQPHNCLKLICASPLAETNSSGIVNKMTSFKPSSNASNFVQLQSMKNTVVFYQEYGYIGQNSVFNPLEHLSYQSTVMQRGIAQNNSKLRLAYLTIEQLNSNNKIK